MAKQKEKDKEIDSSVKPNVSSLIGHKLNDISREDGQTILEFSNGYRLKLSGYTDFEIEKE